MNTLDIILLALFVPGIVRGLRKGILEQAIGLAGLFISYFLAKRFYIKFLALAIELIAKNKLGYLLLKNLSETCE